MGAAKPTWSGVTLSEQIPETTGTVEDATSTEAKHSDIDIDVDALVQERDKWRDLSRKHERNWRAAMKQLREAQASTDVEMAIAEATEKARAEVLTEVGTRLATAELRAIAASQGVDLPDSVIQVLDISRFLNNGLPDTEAMSAFVASLPAASKSPKYPQGVGIGPQGGSGVPQLTREDLSRMTPQQICEARREGRLDALLYGEL